MCSLSTEMDHLNGNQGLFAECTSQRETGLGLPEVTTQMISTWVFESFFYYPQCAISFYYS